MIIGAGVERDVVVRADVARVWELVTDIGVPARFSPELRAVSWVGGATGPALGARFEGHNRNEVLGEWTTLCHVVELDEPHAYAWAVTDPSGRFGPASADPADRLATWRFDLAPEEPGGVRVRLGVRFGPAPSGVTAAVERAPEQENAVVRFRLGMLRDGIDATLAGLRGLAEHG